MSIALSNLMPPDCLRGNFQMLADEMRLEILYESNPLHIKNRLSETMTLIC